MARKIKQKIRDLKEIIELWVKFNNLITEARAKKSATKEEEEKFLNVKTALARKQEALSNTPLSLMNVLNQATTLGDMSVAQELEAKKFYMAWHEMYLSLNELLGKVESGKVEPEIRPEGAKKRHGCLYNFILFLIFVSLVYIGFRIYDRKYDLKSKIRETQLWGNIMQKLGGDKAIDKGKGESK